MQNNIFNLQFLFRKKSTFKICLSVSLFYLTISFSHFQFLSVCVKCIHIQLSIWELRCVQVYMHTCAHVCEPGTNVRSQPY